MVFLGRRQLHDPKSRDYAFEAKPVPHNMRHVFNAQHVDQFYTGGCVGFSGTNALNTARGAISRKRFNTRNHQNYTTHFLRNEDGLRNYHESTVRDPFPGEYPPVDEGSSALGLMKYWKEIGVIESYVWTFTFDSFLAALQRQPVLVGTMWYDDMMWTDDKGLVTSAATGAGGGHEYLASALLWKQRLIGYEQSWGEHSSHFLPTFYMSFDLAEELIINQQGDVAVPKFL